MLSFGVGRFVWCFPRLSTFDIRLYNVVASLGFISHECTNFYVMTDSLCLGLPQMHRFYCLLHSVASHAVFQDFRLYNVVASHEVFQDFYLLTFFFIVLLGLFITLLFFIIFYLLLLINSFIDI